MVAKFRWKTSDLELLPKDGKRYEIIDGELLVTHAPHWGHQKACLRIGSYLDIWSLETNLGEVTAGPDVLFTDADNVIPDVAWISKSRLPMVLDDSGHLTEAPDLAVEVLSLGEDNQRRDRQLKRGLYSAQGVKEYWILDWRAKKVEVYRRESAQLTLQATLFEGDTLTSPMLPEFSCPIERLFA
ncbi:MAG: Uma2 family endonuclease [Cyanobacteria bacterium J06597_16]